MLKITAEEWRKGFKEGIALEQMPRPDRSEQTRLMMDMQGINMKSFALALIATPFLCSAPNAQMVEVSTRDQLLRALSLAGGGETIILADGNYGSLDIVDRAYSDYVTITSRFPKRAVFEDIDVVNSSYVRINDIHVDNTSNGTSSSTLVAVIDGSHHVDVLNSEINGRIDGIYNGHFGLYTNGGVSSVTFEGNFLHDIKRGGVFYDVKDLTVRTNVVDDIGDDSFKFIGVKGVLIENNVGARHVYPEPGAHLDFIQFQGSASQNIVIRGNVALPGNQSSVQGIFLDDAFYSNVLIEKNVIVTGMIRGISVSKGANVTARFNTVLDIEGFGSKATLVMVPGKSYGNIMSTYAGDPRLGKTEGNLYLQQTNAESAWHYDTYFENGNVGFGMSLEDLVPAGNLNTTKFGAPLPKGKQMNHSRP